MEDGKGASWGVSWDRGHAGEGAEEVADAKDSSMSIASVDGNDIS